MGGGGTITQGLRRLFQRRAPPSSSPAYDDNNDRVFLRDLRAQLASIPTQDHQTLPPIHQHFDISSLKPIRVPTPALFPFSSMDPHKKVHHFLFNTMICLCLLFLWLTGYCYFCFFIIFCLSDSDMVYHDFDSFTVTFLKALD